MGVPTGTTALISWLVTTLVVLIVIQITARFLDHRPVSEYGFRLSRGWWVDLTAGVVFGSLIIVMTLVTAYLLGSVTLPEEGLRVGPVSPIWLVAFLIGFAGVALWEEIVFRGVVMTNAFDGLTEWGSSRTVAIWVALIGSAGIFALVHVPGEVSEGNSPWLAAFWTFSLGSLLGVSYLLSGELALPMGLHLSINYVSGNVFGIAGVAQLEGVPTLFVLESATSGIVAPMNGIPIIISNLLGIVLVAGWCYWRRGPLEFTLNDSQSKTYRGRKTPASTSGK